MSQFNIFDEQGIARFKKVLKSNGIDLENEAVEDVIGVLDSLVFEKMQGVSREIGKQLKGRVESEVRHRTERNRKQIVSKLGDVLNGVVLHWVKENRVNINRVTQDAVNQRALTAVVEALKTNYVQIPESDVDIVQSLTQKVESIENSYAAVSKQLRSAMSANSDLKRRMIVESASHNLTESERERLAREASTLRSENLAAFGRQVQTLRKSIVNKESIENRRREPGVRLTRENRRPKRNKSGDDLINSAARILGSGQ